MRAPHLRRLVNASRSSNIKSLRVACVTRGSAETQRKTDITAWMLGFAEALPNLLKSLLSRFKWVAPSTIDDPAILSEITEELRQHHIGQFQ